jgi:hypothetical protein
MWHAASRRPLHSRPRVAPRLGHRDAQVPLRSGGVDASPKIAVRGILSNSPGINRLSVARLALFAARAVWLVISVPMVLASVLGWPPTQVGGFMAVWVIAYGGVQSVSPLLLAKVTGGHAPGASAVSWAGATGDDD